MQKFYQFIVIVSLCGSTYASSSSIFHLVPNTHDVSQGRGATLNCALKDEYADVYTLSWVMDSRDAANDRRKIGPEGRLHIEKVDKDLDKGQFQCVATNRSNPNDQVFTNPASLNIKWLDIYGVIRLSPDSEEVLPGNKVIMKCNVSGKPRPQVQEIYWKRGDNRINKDAEDGLYSYNRARIIIDRVELGKFDGRYSCCIGEECSHIKYDLKVRDKATPVLVKKPKDTVVRVRSNAVLSCKFDAVPEPKVEWYHDDDPIKIKPPDSCRICAFKNGTLLVKDVKDRFQGIYKCVATGDNGQTAEGSAELSLAYIKISDGNIEEELLDPGQNDEKYCGHVDAKPEASITWYKDDQLITNSSMTGITVYGSTLIINSAQQSDEGKYKCVAVNVAGNVTKLYNFRIKKKPKMKSSLISRTEKEGSDVTIVCSADGLPEPEYTWYQNKTVIAKSDHYFIVGGELTIKSITPSDSATYKCVAGNDQGEDSSSGSIMVEERLKFDPVPTDVCVEVNKTAEIVCGARGVNNAKVDWTIESKSVKYEIITHNPAKKTLRILPNSKSGDHWEAFCTARSSRVGSNVEAPISVPVIVSVGKKPEIYKPPQSSVVFEEQSVRFDCGVYPEIKLEKLYWTILNQNSTVKEFTVKNNSESVKYTIMNNGSFIIKGTGIEDSGVYACHYEACGFVVTKKATLNVAERDEPITTPDNQDTNSSDGSTPGYQKIQTVALASGGAIAYLSITIIIIVYCRRKRHYKKGKAGKNQGDEETAMLNNGASHALQLEPITKLPDNISDLQYDHTKLEHVAEIGQGNFGKVYLSKAPGLLPDVGDDVLVMVKTMSPEESSDRQSNNHVAKKNSIKLEFNREIKLLFTANHENIGRLLGVCSEHTNSITNPDCLITEYLEWGILKLCLHASQEGKIHRFSKHSKMKMCCQLAAGLEHLSSLGMCHSDVATRNCLISSKHVVKLSVLGLSKDGFEKEYSSHKGQLRPIRWMPPETLHNDEIHLKSDVWSYGVACWEIFTLGKTPYSDLSDEEFLQEMRSDCPPTLPTIDGSKRIASLISKCCHRDHHARPEFQQIVKKLQSVIRTETKVKTSDEGIVDVHEPLLPQNEKGSEDPVT